MKLYVAYSTRFGIASAILPDMRVPRTEAHMIELEDIVERRALGWTFHLVRSARPTILACHELED